MENQAIEKLFKEHFDPKKYLDRQTKQDIALFTFFETELHAIFDEMDVSSGMKLLDVGCGPTFGNVLAASRKFDHIVLSDLVKNNLLEMEKVVHGIQGATDWSRSAEAQAYREGYFMLQQGGREIIERTRMSVKKVVPCNIYWPQVLPVEHSDTFDVVLSILCLDTATTSSKTYQEALGRLSSLVKRGGRLILGGICGKSDYYVGTQMFPSFDLDEETIHGSLKASGFNVSRWKVRRLDRKKEPDTADLRFDFSYVIVGTKSL